MEENTIFCKFAGGVKGSFWEAIQVKLRKTNWTQFGKEMKKHFRHRQEHDGERNKKPGYTCKTISSVAP